MKKKRIVLYGREGTLLLSSSWMILLEELEDHTDMKAARRALNDPTVEVPD